MIRAAAADPEPTEVAADAQASADPADVLRVVRGNPDGAEVAAVVTVLGIVAGRVAGRSTAPSPAPWIRTRAYVPPTAWNAPHFAHRRTKNQGDLSDSVVVPCAKSR